MHLLNGAGTQITNIFPTPLGKSELNIKALSHCCESFYLLPFDAHH